jgi:large subunit ribosomal protein L17
MGVTREHRRAMLSNLATALITHGRIQTTLSKAKALRPFIEKVITKAKKAAGKTGKKDALHLRRLALQDVRDEDAVTLLFNEKYKDFVNRSGGYTRIYKLGPRRISDAAEMALIEFVKAEDTGYTKSKGRRPAKGRKAPKAKAEAAVAAPSSEAVPEKPSEAAPEAPAASAEAAADKAAAGAAPETKSDAPAKPEGETKI